MDTKNPPAGSRGGRASVSCALDAVSLTENPPALQPATVTELRALRLIDRHRVRPELAMTLAALAFGGGRANG